jgi:hypothetical protein
MIPVEDDGEQMDWSFSSTRLSMAWTEVEDGHGGADISFVLKSIELVCLT